MSLENDYNDLVRRFRILQRTNEDLRDEIIHLNREGDKKNRRISELEPLERAKNKSYDTYVSSGGNDTCFNVGMSGNCGPECPIYGSKPECESDDEDEKGAPNE